MTDSTVLRSSEVRRGDSSPFHFNDIIDCPGITLKKGEWVTLRYSYLWHGLERKRAACEVMPLQMHLKDYIKMREKTLQLAHAREQLQGDAPKFSNISAHITYGDPTRSPYTR